MDIAETITAIAALIAAIAELIKAIALLTKDRKPKRKRRRR
ncbi:hypothetical protein ACLUWO_04115 [Pseudoscardovia radai]